MSDAVNDHFGPIDFFVVEFPDGRPTGAGFDVLLGLADAGTINVIDVEFVRRSGSTVTRVDAGTFDDAGVAAFEGASSGLLDEEDLAHLAGELADGAVAAIVVYEELAVLAAFDAFEAGGAHLHSEGHLSVAELVDALDATDPK